MSVKATTRRGKAVWLVQVLRDGGKFNKRRFLRRSRYRKTDAEEVEAELIAEYEASRQGGRPPSKSTSTPASIIEYPAQTESKAPAFASFAERFLAIQDASKSDYRNKVRNLRIHLLPFFGATPLDQITRMMIDDFKIKLRSPTGEKASHRRSLTRKEKPVTHRRKGTPKSPKTINNILTTLRSMLKLAYEYELLDRMPMVKAEPVSKTDPGYLEDREVKLLIEHAPPEWRVFLLMGARTGLRRSELLELRWGDLVLKAKRPRVRVRRALRFESGGVITVKETKSRRPRSVPLSRALVTTLRDHRPRGARPDDLVFPGPNQGYMSQNQLRHMLVKTRAAAGLEKHVHVHLLRHTFASQCYRRGIPPQVVQMWLGHAQISTTERYAHLSPDAGEDLIDLLDTPFGEAMGNVCEITNTTTNTTGGQTLKNAV